MTEDKGILIKNVYYMLAYAFQELKQNNYEQIEGEQFEEIHDLFAEILIRAISFQLKQGLYRQYVPRQESMYSVRGKINLAGSIKHRTRQSNMLTCEYDELSEDNIYNQIVVTTSRILIQHPNVKKNRKAQLKKLMLFFSNVQEIDVRNIHWNMLRFDRNNMHYRMILYLCYFILDNMLLSTDEGKYKIREFSDEHMCRLFEKFVLEYYKKHHPYLKARAEQVNWNINEEASSVSILPIMQTDIMLQKGERTLIVDTKYYSQIRQYHFDKSTIHSHNQYQIFTYVMNHDREHLGNVDGMLLYAKTQEDIVADGQMGYIDGNVIYYRTLDLNQDFEKIKERLDSFVL